MAIGCVERTACVTEAPTLPTAELSKASLVVPCHRYVWESNATGGFAISEDKDGEPIERGTQIKLFLKVYTCQGVNTLLSVIPFHNCHKQGAGLYRNPDVPEQGPNTCSLRVYGYLS